MYTEAGSQEEFIQSVLRKFHEEEYFYTLEPPVLGNNPVDVFLFDTQQGFCEHYASAFAVMMRSAGIPARIVLGYQGGELNPKAGHLIVRPVRRARLDGSLDARHRLVPRRPNGGGRSRAY